MSTRKFTILAVDDSDDDLLLLKMAFRKSDRLSLIHMANSGEEAVAYLKGERQFAERAKFPLPDMVLLDLKMPRMNGFEVLAKLQEAKLPQAPVVVALSSSALPGDIERALSLGARFYQTKPTTILQLADVIRDLESKLDQLNDVETSVAAA